MYKNLILSFFTLNVDLLLRKSRLVHRLLQAERYMQLGNDKKKSMHVDERGGAGSVKSFPLRRNIAILHSNFLKV
jgi:hypothetical protein